MKIQPFAAFFNVPLRLASTAAVAVTLLGVAASGAVARNGDGQGDAKQDQRTQKDVTAAVEDAEKPTKPELREQLLAKVEVDQKARFKLIEAMQKSAAEGKGNQPDMAVMQELMKVDAENRAWLIGVVEESGWPGKTQVGVDGAHAAWLLVQHADADPKFQRKCLDLMKALPQGEVSGTDIAYLTDRVLCAENKPQLYGTQLITVGDKMVPKEIEDEANVDKRRAELGMPPLAEYIKMTTEVYLGKQKDAAKQDNAKLGDGKSDGGKGNLW